MKNKSSFLCHQEYLFQQVFRCNTKFWIGLGQKLNGFSIHVGRNELIWFGECCKGADQRVMLVHSEGTALEAWRSGLAERDVRNITIVDDKFTVEV